MTARVASFSTLLRLAMIGSRADRYRLALIALGASVCTLFATAALVVLAIDGYDDRYTNNILKEPGLRPGVAIACWLLLIPALIFIGMCSRVCAAQRERRFATFRLSGATPNQVRSICAAETGLASLAGALLGLSVSLIVRAALASRVSDERHLALPVIEPFPWIAAIVFCLLMPALTGLVGILSLHGVAIGPLGVARRHRRERPSGWPGVLLISGPFAIALGNRLTAFNIGGAWQFILVAGVAATCIGILFAAAWLSATIGALTARATGRADLLIAARRLETDPYGQSWTMSSVIVCAFFASVAAVFKASAFSSYDARNDDFYARGFELVNIGLLIALTIAAAGLLVAPAEGILERRRSLAALVAAGTSLGTLRRAVIFQGLLPLVPAVLLATAVGSMVYFAVVGSSLDSSATDREIGQFGSIEMAVSEPSFPFTDLVKIAAVGVGASILASSLSLPFLERSVRPSELRFE